MLTKNAQSTTSMKRAASTSSLKRAPLHTVQNKNSTAASQNPLQTGAMKKAAGNRQHCGATATFVGEGVKPHSPSCTTAWDEESVTALLSSYQGVAAPTTQQRVQVLIRVKPLLPTPSQIQQGGSVDSSFQTQTANFLQAPTTVVDTSRNVIRVSQLPRHSSFSSATPSAMQSFQFDGVFSHDFAASRFHYQKKISKESRMRKNGAAFPANEYNEEGSLVVTREGQNTAMDEEQHMFEKIGLPCVESCCQHSYDVCIFAYGQTGSGKTLSMLGGEKRSFDQEENCWSKADDDEVEAGKTFSSASTTQYVDGLIPRVCRAIIDEYAKKETEMENTQREFLLSQEKSQRKYQQHEDEEGETGMSMIASKVTYAVSFVEILKEQIFCLLSNNRKQYKVRENVSSQFFLEGLRPTDVQSAAEAVELLRVAARRHRTTSSTLMNDQSSRSHAIFTLHIRQHYFNPKNGVVRQHEHRVYFVDLAGSERVGAHCNQNLRANNLDENPVASSSNNLTALLEQGVGINLSLLHLGKVIDALCDKATSSAGNQNGASIQSASHHVPYRGSVLTKLLKEALGGRAKTFMLGNIVPLSVEESLSTLRYCSRASQIVNAVGVPCSESEDCHTKELRELQSTILTLHRELRRRNEDVEKVQTASLGLVAQLSVFRQQQEKKSDSPFHSNKPSHNSINVSTSPNSTEDQKSSTSPKEEKSTYAEERSDHDTGVILAELSTTPFLAFISSIPKTASSLFHCLVPLGLYLSQPITRIEIGVNLNASIFWPVQCYQQASAPSDDSILSLHIPLLYLKELLQYQCFMDKREITGIDQQKSDSEIAEAWMANVTSSSSDSQIGKTFPLCCCKIIAKEEVVGEKIVEMQHGFCSPTTSQICQKSGSKKHQSWYLVSEKKGEEGVGISSLGFTGGDSEEAEIVRSKLLDAVHISLNGAPLLKDGSASRMNRHEEEGDVKREELKIFDNDVMDIARGCFKFRYISPSVSTRSHATVGRVPSGRPLDFSAYRQSVGMLSSKRTPQRRPEEKKEESFGNFFSSPESEMETTTSSKRNDSPKKVEEDLSIHEGVVKTEEGNNNDNGTPLKCIAADEEENPTFEKEKQGKLEQEIISLQRRLQDVEAEKDYYLRYEMKKTKQLEEQCYELRERLSEERMRSTHLCEDADGMGFRIQHLETNLAEVLQKYREMEKKYGTLEKLYQEESHRRCFVDGEMESGVVGLSPRKNIGGKKTQFTPIGRSEKETLMPQQQEMISPPAVISSSPVLSPKCNEHPHGGTSARHSLAPVDSQQFTTAVIVELERSVAELNSIVLMKDSNIQRLASRDVELSKQNQKLKTEVEKYHELKRQFQEVKKERDVYFSEIKAKVAGEQQAAATSILPRTANRPATAVLHGRKMQEEESVLSRMKKQR